MVRKCGPDRVVEFTANDRDYIQWTVTHLTPAAVVTVELEKNGVLIPLSGQPELGILRGLFAGPSVQNPAPATVFNTTSHCVLHVVDGEIRRDLDGGMIHLIP